MVERDDGGAAFRGLAGSLALISEEPARSPAVRCCFEQYYAELDRRFVMGFDVASALPLGLDELTPPRGMVLLARFDGVPVGCGALKLADPRVGAITRLLYRRRGYVEVTPFNDERYADHWFEKVLAPDDQP